MIQWEEKEPSAFHVGLKLEISNEFYEKRLAFLNSNKTVPLFSEQLMNNCKHLSLE